MATIIATGSVMVQYDGKNIYPAGGSYPVVDSYDNYQKYLTDVSAGIVSAGATGFTNVVNLDETYIYKTVDFSTVSAQTVGTHEVFTVTGMVRMKILAECTETLVGSVNTTEIAFGTDTSGSAWIGGTSANIIASGEMWCDSSPTEVQGAYSTVVLDKVVTAGKDIGYTVGTTEVSAGIMTFHCWWSPLNSSGAVATGHLSTMA